MDMMPSANKTKINADTLKDVYIGKMVKVRSIPALYDVATPCNRCGTNKIIVKTRPLRCLVMTIVGRFSR